MIFNQQSLSESEVKLLVKAADRVYQDQMSLDGWQVITPDLTNPNYGLDSELITGNTFKAEGDLLNLPFGDANAAVLKSGDNLLLAFRGRGLRSKRTDNNAKLSSFVDSTKKYLINSMVWNL